MVIAIPSQRNEFRQAAGRMLAPMMETEFLRDSGLETGISAETFNCRCLRTRREADRQNKR